MTILTPCCCEQYNQDKIRLCKCSPGVPNTKCAIVNVQSTDWMLTPGFHIDMYQDKTGAPHQMPSERHQNFPAVACRLLTQSLLMTAKEKYHTSTVCCFFYWKLHAHVQKQELGLTTRFQRTHSSLGPSWNEKAMILLI